MSSEADKLIEAITELVLQELEKCGAPESEPNVSPSPPPPKKAAGARLLVAPGGGAVEAEFWTGLAQAEGVSPSVLVWNGARQDQLPSQCGGWKLEARTSNWDQVVSAQRALVLVGADLTLLGSLASFGGDGSPPACAATAALASGKPVFVDNTHYESLRRHSSRLASGFVRRFEELFRLVSSFGVEFGGAPELATFLKKVVGKTAATSNPQNRSGGRDVVTTEDVEAVRRSGQKTLRVALGPIVTPLAAHKAREWGIEVVFQ